MPRTYSVRPAKRQRLDSPDTPDSSSPSPKQFRSKKSTFSFLKRPTTKPLSHDGVDKIYDPTAAKKAKRMKQMTLDLGQTMTVTCNECGMSYTPSQPSDAALHAKHHARSAIITSSPPEIPLGILQSMEKSNSVWSSGDKQIIRITKQDDIGKRKIAEKMLQAATTDLGAIDISPASLWSDYSDLTTMSNGARGSGRYQLFLYLHGRNCVGILLVEGIPQAYRVLNTSFPIVTSQSEENLDTKPDSDPTVMGISRIWTHRSMRRAGVASKILDIARKEFQPFFIVAKNKVAFSQPTEQGANLARRWFGMDDGWLVYVD